MQDESETQNGRGLPKEDSEYQDPKPQSHWIELGLQDLQAARLLSPTKFCLHSLL